MSKPTYSELITGDDAYVKQIEQAYLEAHGHPPNITDQAHNIWRLLMEDWTLSNVLHDIKGEPLDGPGIVTGPRPDPIPLPAGVDLTTWPRYGMSVSVVLNPKNDLVGVVRAYQEAGVRLTSTNLLGTAWMNPDQNFMPFRRLQSGQWDLFAWDNRFYERLAETQERMNAAGVVVQWTGYNLYDWSRRKAGDQTGTPWRNNVNGVYWSPDDTTLYNLPDEWSIAFFEKTVPYLKLNPNIYKIGNEFPEKPLHVRVAQQIRRIQPNALICVNRNEDTPGQYRNMKIGKGDFDFIEFHGFKLNSVDDLDRDYPSEIGKDLDADDIPNFKEMFKPVRPQQGKVDPKRIIFNSDGARISDDPVNTYDYDKLRAFFRKVKSLGCSIDHQSRAKMTDQPNHHMIETDWFKSVIA